MPFGLFGGRSRIRFSKKRTYSLRHDEVTGGGRFPAGSIGGHRNSAPSGILKKSGRQRPKSYPAFAEGMMPQEMAAAVPMPSEPELNAMFTQMVDELGLSRELMFKLPPQKRWELYLSKQKEQQSTKGADPQPEYYIDQIAQMTMMLRSATAESADDDQYMTVVSDLKTALRTQPISFVLRFVEQNGLEYLLEFFKSMNSHVRQSQLHHTYVGCVKALMNSPDGRAHVLAHPNGITVIAQSIRTNNIKTKILALEILGALCLVPGGHKKVLVAMEHFQKFAMERIRFQTLIVDLARSLDDHQDAASLQIAVLSFVNAIINYKAGEETLEFRMHLRHEFLMLGILPVINRLRALNIAHLNKHLEIFELVRIEDEREFSARLEAVAVDSSSLKSMIDLLQRKTAHTTAHSYLLSVVYHCLLLPLDDPLYSKYWHLIDRMVQQIVLQQRQGIDPDASLAPLNVHGLVQQLAKEEEVRALRLEAEEMQKSRDELRLKLRKKEWECESRTMERDQQRANVEKLRLKMNRKATELNEAWQHQQELQDRTQQLKQQAEEQHHRITQLEALLRENNISLDEFPSLPIPPPSQPSPPPLPPPITSPPLPLPPPAAPVPPAPPLAPEAPQFSTLRRKKQVPKPSQALKSFNWAKLHESQINQTVWNDIDDSKVHAVMDLEDFEHTFSAYQHRASSPTSTLRRRSRLVGERPKELTVIDGRRAQNCTIVLSKLKMTDAEIRQAVLSMDHKDQLNKDMLEQLLKFVPTSTEVELLGSHIAEEETFARADHFLLEMSRIPRYRQRLKSLYFKKTLDERLGDIKPRVEDVLFGCQEVVTSQKLRKVLEVVLAFGNFMNRGNRANAFGFKLTSLNKIMDTKSSTDRDVTLLHYLVKTLESKFPDALTLGTELPHIRNAAKVDWKELEKEFLELRSDLSELQQEIEYHKHHHSGEPDDHFVPTMEGFAANTAVTCIKLEALINQMKSQFEQTLSFFGEDPAEMSTDEFFGIFSTFLQSFSEAHVEIIAARKKREEEQKRKEEMEKQKELTLKRRRNRQQAAGTENAAAANRTSSDYADNAEFDELIAALKSGAYFEAYARRRGRRGSGVVASPRNSRLLEFSRERLPSGEDPTIPLVPLHEPY